jgi:hypothetical protein
VGACREVHDHVHSGQRRLPIGIRADIADTDDVDGGRERGQGRTLAPHCRRDRMARGSEARAQAQADKAAGAGDQDRG